MIIASPDEGANRDDFLIEMGTVRDMDEGAENEVQIRGELGAGINPAPTKISKTTQR